MKRLKRFGGFKNEMSGTFSKIDETFFTTPKKGQSVWFKKKVDEYGYGNFSIVTIRDVVSEIRDGMIFLEGGYTFDLETQMMIDEEYYDKFPYDKVKLYKSTIGY